MSGGAVNITSLQYYFTGNSQTSETFTYQLPAPAPLADLNFTADLSKLEGNREYEMHIVAVNIEGNKSPEVTKKIKVCNEQPAKAKFDFITMGNQISLIDSSSGAASYFWDFGDGQKDSVSNPVHVFGEGGNYRVHQRVRNFCNMDSLTKIVPVVALQSVFPKNGGDVGTVTLSITGSGFTAQTTAKLKRSNATIQASRLDVSKDGHTLYAIFELYGKETGTYDLEVQTGGSSATLTSTFRLEPAVAPKFLTEIIGRNAIRRNSEQVFEIKVENRSNTDAYLVPASLIVPDNVTVKPDFVIISMESIPGVMPFGEDSVTFLIHEDGKTVLPLLLPKIPAYGSVRFSVKLKTSSSQSELEMVVHVFNPLYQPKQSGPSQETGRKFEEEQDVASACFKVAADLGIDIAAKYLGKKCATKIGIQLGLYLKNIVDFIMDSEELRNSEDNLKKTFAITNFIAGMEPLSNMDEIAEACFDEALKAPFKSAFKKALGTILTVLSVGEASYSLGRDCIAPALPKLLQIVNSFDPNEKVGPSYNKEKNHIRQGVPLEYTIYFENKSTATASAQEVIIVDTIDKSKFDLATFQLQAFGFGDSVSTYIPTGFSSYSTSTLLHRAGKPNLSVRVDAKLDTSTGILKWRFISLDPITRELIDDPLDGFLPPNKRSPEGEGYISYSIQPKQGLPFGTEIRNKAAIYFDNNEAIVTNEFLNTIDNIQPVSKVASLPAVTSDTAFTVQWGGTDQGAGIRSYDVYYAVNNGLFKLWQYDVSLTESIFTGQRDSTYSFYSISKDYAGNIEPPKLTGEATIRINTAQGPLPISLLSFIARLSGKNSLLDWITTSEQNSSHFNVERSTDGIRFTNIATIKAAGNSNTTLSYSYTDTNIARLNSEKIYYRLQMVDRDGKFKYSSIIELYPDNQGFYVKALPNPVANEVNLSIAISKEQFCNITVMNAAGKTIMNDKKALISGINLLQYNTTSWSKGLYVIKVTTGEGLLKTIKVLKQ